ncbi:MAG: M48 family metalloprotease [Thaumarchaeota archaeon]|nr:M48 family metalloprotease [Nitrososphaerota archaeon]MCL5316969.1 M48 family metalloprotease [Nitrososphaerota archaeon]
MQRLSFQDEIARNKRNSIVLIASAIVFLIGLVYFFGYIFAPGYLLFILPFASIFVLIYIYGDYMYGDRIVLSAVHAQPAEGREYQYLRDTVEGLSIAAGIPPPKIYVMQSDEINAFATGRDPQHASVAVTTGALSNLNRQELEGVLAHELSHVRNRDILFATLIAVVVGLAAIISQIILRSFLWGGGPRGRSDERRGGGGLPIVIIIIIGLILAVVAPLLVRLIQFAISRRREYLADASGAELTRYPEGLASALEKIMNRNKSNMDVSEAVSHLFFTDPRRTSLDSLFDTHPPIAERIKRLRAM